MPRNRFTVLAILESKFCAFLPFFTRRLIITATTLAEQSDNNISSSAISMFAPKCAVVAQQKLNDYSTSFNNVSTSRTIVQHICCSTNVETCIIGFNATFAARQVARKCSPHYLSLMVCKKTTRFVAVTRQGPQGQMNIDKRVKQLTDIFLMCASPFYCQKDKPCLRFFSIS